MKIKTNASQYPIDFVVTWVDGADVEWLKKKSLYKAEDSIEDCVQRYRDWDIFKYWFRAVEKYAPWVNNIYVVTDSQKPNFLNEKHPKVKLISHEEFIPKQYLPTFSSHVIENHLHRIEGLSEQFVYFNDDMFLNRDIYPKDFFRKGKPCYELIERPYVPMMPMGAHNYATVNNMAIINKHFTRKSMRQKISRFFSFQYGKSGLKNICMLPWRNYQHFEDNHMPTPYLKSTFEEVWELEGEYLGKISQNKFRHCSDVNHFLFRYWDLARGNFVPYHLKSGYYSINRNTVTECVKDIEMSKSLMICVNDGGDLESFEKDRDLIRDAFEKKYPTKSRFEMK